MNLYVALLTGQGEGCDYTIGCNKSFEVFKAKDSNAAIERCRSMWEEQGGSGGDPRIESIRLFAVEDELQIYVQKWNEAGEERAERFSAEEELDRLEAQARDLRVKLGKKK